MAQLILSAASAAGRAGIGTILARTVASTATSYAAGAAERLIFGPRKRTVEGPRLESFTIQASTSGSDPGLGGSTVNATITVTAVNDPPTITPTASPTRMFRIFASEVGAAYQSHGWRSAGVRGTILVFENE